MPSPSRVPERSSTFDLSHEVRWLRRPGLARAGALAAIIGLAGSVVASPAASQAAQVPDSLPEAVTPERMAEGYELFQALSCAACHGDMGRGAANGPNLQDGEWLHSTGDYDGIHNTLRWGVRKEEIKAMTRPWEMRPRGGEHLDHLQLQSIAAYIWGQANGLFERSLEDEFVDFVFARPAAEVQARYAELAAASDAPVFTEDRMLSVALSVATNRSMDDGLALIGVVLAEYPASADAHYLAGRIHATRGENAEARGALGRALELNPDHADARSLLARVGGGGAT